MTIKALQTEVDQWIQRYGVRYFHELTNLALLMEEVGELARITARTYGEQSFRPGSEPSDMQEAIADEMADILFVLTCLANQMHVDLETAISKNLEKKTRRDQDRHKQNPKLS
jgi:NTP pyrophosphatase (non-canonical NTP hydrolase)